MEGGDAQCPPKFSGLIDETWNPISGCTKVSPGCAYCYAERLTLRFGGKPFLPGQAEIKLRPDRIDAPLHWKKPRLVFVNSMSDLFHEDVPDAFIRDVFWTMQRAGWHTFQVLTKRPERMRTFLLDAPVLPNIWLGVSAENQRWLDARVPLLLSTPAVVRFVSLEPLLGPIDLRARPDKRMCLHCGGMPEDVHAGHLYRTDGLSWVICGGESGGPEDRRLVEKCRTDSGMPIHRFNVVGQPDEHAGRVHKPCGGTGWRPKPEALEWVRAIRDQCVAADVPYFWKQWGGPRPTSGGRGLDGREWNEMPGGSE